MSLIQIMNQILIIFIVLVIVCLLLSIIGLLVEEDEVPEKIWHVYNGSNPITRALVDNHNELFFTTPTPTSCDEYNRFVTTYLADWLNIVSTYIEDPVNDYDDGMSSIEGALHEFDMLVFKRNFATRPKWMEFWCTKKNMEKYTPECLPYGDFNGSFIFGPDSKLKRTLGCECVQNRCGIDKVTPGNWVEDALNGMYTEPKDKGFIYDDIITNVSKVLFPSSDEPITCESQQIDILMLGNYSVYLYEQASESTREQASFELPDCDQTMASHPKGHDDYVSCDDQELIAKLGHLLGIAYETEANSRSVPVVDVSSALVNFDDSNC